ncbi:MAG: hypothetical protein AB1500_04255 [Bacillota bacterium]
MQSLQVSGKLFTATTSIGTPGIKDKEKLVEILLGMPGVEKVVIVGKQVNVTYEPSTISAMLINQMVKENSIFVSKG